MNERNTMSSGSPALPFRRHAMQGLLGAAASVMAWPASAAGQVSTPGDTPAASADAAALATGSTRRIDVHAHYLPERYRREAIAAGHSRPDGMPRLPDWSVDRALEFMDARGIGTSMLSISSPGVHFGDSAAASALARHVNEVGANAMRDHPGRFGLFASLPLPDLDASLAELSYALDTLHADGVVLETNHHGVYLGDARLDAVFSELDRRDGVVFIHPTSPSCPCCETTSLGYPRPMMEFLFETTRAVTHLLLSGTLDKYPRVRIIVPHAGATLPILIDRVVGLSPALGLDKPVDADRLYASLKGLHYDLAGFPVPRLLGALLQIADPAHLHYGSDWPFTPDPVVDKLAQALTTTELLTPTQRLAMWGGNARRLFPRLSSGGAQAA